MNLNSRLSKLERSLNSNICPLCQWTYPTEVAAQKLVDEQVSELRSEGWTEIEARGIVIEAAPHLALRLGLIKGAPPAAHRCRLCAHDLRSPPEMAKDTLLEYTALLDGDVEQARALLREDWPEGARLTLGAQ